VSIDEGYRAIIVENYSIEEGHMTTVLAVAYANTMSAIVQTILEAKDLSVTTADDGVDTLEELTVTHIDMAIVHFHMPNMNGVFSSENHENTR